MARSAANDEPVTLDGMYFLLRRVTRRFDETVRAALLPAELGPREYALLSLLAEEGALSQQAAAARLGIDRTSMVSLVDGLENREFVTRERDRADRRAYRLVLTTGGEKRRRQAARAVQQGEARAFAVLAEKDQRRLRRFLETLADNGESTAAQDE